MRARVLSAWRNTLLSGIARGRETTSRTAPTLLCHLGLDQQLRLSKETILAARPSISMTRVRHQPERLIFAVLRSCDAKQPERLVHAGLLDPERTLIPRHHVIRPVP